MDTLTSTSDAVKAGMRNIAAQFVLAAKPQMDLYVEQLRLESTAADQAFDPNALQASLTALSSILDRVSKVIAPAIEKTNPQEPQPIATIGYGQGEYANEPRLEVLTPKGALVCSYFGHPQNGYDGLAIDLVKPNGYSTQCCIVETTPDNILHTLAWDGNDECAVVDQEIDTEGDYVY